MSLSTGDETTQHIHVGGILIQAEIVIKIEIDTGQSGQRANQLSKSPDITPTRPGRKPVKTDITKVPTPTTCSPGMDRCRR